MLLLPRGNPVKEKIDPGKISLPDALKKLQDGNFSGYLRFEAVTGTGIMIFERGKLISALFEGNRDRLIANDAIVRLFELSLAGGVNLDIYRLSPELALSIQALLHGDVLYRGQELKLIDIKALLARFKEERLSGCLRIYTEEHVALIFYRDGSPLGFFHDGATDIEPTPGSSMSVARLPGAKLDVLSSKESGSMELADLLESADVTGFWTHAQEHVTRQRRQQDAEQARSQEQLEHGRRQKLHAALRGAAERQIGKIGQSLVDKEFERLAAAPGVLSEAAFGPFFDNLAKAAKLVAGPSKIEAMLEEMRRLVRGAAGKL